MLFLIFIARTSRLVEDCCLKKVLNQTFLVVRLKWPLRKFYVRHHDLVNRNICLMNDHYCFPLSWFIIRFIARVTLEEQGLVPSILPLVLSGDRNTQSVVFCLVLCRPLFVIVVLFFFWPWYCVSFHLLFLVILLISSNFS